MDPLFGWIVIRRLRSIDQNLGSGSVAQPTAKKEAAVWTAQRRLAWRRQTAVGAQGHRQFWTGMGLGFISFILGITALSFWTEVGDGFVNRNPLHAVLVSALSLVVGLICLSHLAEAGRKLTPPASWRPSR